MGASLWRRASNNIARAARFYRSDFRAGAVAAQDSDNLSYQPKVTQLEVSGLSSGVGRAEVRFRSKGIDRHVRVTSALPPKRTFRSAVSLSAMRTWPLVWARHSYLMISSTIESTAKRNGQLQRLRGLQVSTSSNVVA